MFQTITVASLSFTAIIAAGAIGLNVLNDVLTLDRDLMIGWTTFALKCSRVAQSLVLFFFFCLNFASSIFRGIVRMVYLIPITVRGCIVAYSALSLLKNPNAQNVNKRIRIFKTSAVVYPISQSRMRSFNL